jgi:DNA-binding MarR family transcriptional regulator
VAETPSVLIELHGADRLVRTLVMEEMERHGLRPSLFAILVLIASHAPITPTALAAESGARPTTIRDMVNQMVERGHVRRFENADDRRSHFLELTPDGAQFVADASRALHAVEGELAQELGRPLEELREPLQQLRRAARALYVRSG